jgi:ribosomal protein S18 acetylase RimI-like enzyme
MKNISIKFATKEDEEFIKKMHKESKEEIGNFNLFFSWDNYLSKKSPYNFYIVKDGDKNIGFMRFGMSKQLKCYVVKEIAISNQFRGQGYGKKFIEKMPKPIYLTCNTDNLSGNAFYEKVGFMNKGKKKTKSGKWTNIWILQ